MKNFFALIIFFLILPLWASADCYPSYLNSDLHTGNGLISISGSVKIYDNDSDSADIVAEININENDFSVMQKGVSKIDESDIFIAKNSEKKLALLSVEYDTDNWYYICYNQKLKLFGWVKKSSDIDFIGWSDFYNVYGRKYGLYLFRNVSEKYKKLYSAPDVNSSAVDSFAYAKHIALWLVSGDWILAKVTTYDGITKTGWLRWRLSDKSILVFPDIRY